MVYLTRLIVNSTQVVDQNNSHAGQIDHCLSQFNPLIKTLILIIFAPFERKILSWMAKWNYMAKFRDGKE